MRSKRESMCGYEHGHLFLSPLFDMVKCSLILLLGPFFLYYSLQMDWDRALLSSFRCCTSSVVFPPVLIRLEPHVSWRKGGGGGAEMIDGGI